MSFENFCVQLQKRNQGWDTDELFLERVDAFDSRRIQKFHQLNLEWQLQELIGINWEYNPERINRYIDSHLLRPYSMYKEIDKLKLSIMNKLLNDSLPYITGMGYRKLCDFLCG